MNRNIVLVGLDYETIKSTAILLSSEFDMFFLDINDLIKYNFKDEENIISIVGVEYYNKQIKKIVSSICDYENTIINCPYDLFLDEHIRENLEKNAISIFIDISKKDMSYLNNKKQLNEKLDIPLLAYEELKSELINISNYVVKYNKDVKNIIKDIKNIMGWYNEYKPKMHKWIKVNEC